MRCGEHSGTVDRGRTGMPSDGRGFQMSPFVEGLDQLAINFRGLAAVDVKDDSRDE